MKQAMPYAVLGLGIIIMGGIAWWFSGRLDTTPVPVGTEGTAPDVSEGVSIYTNGVYGFLVSYPDGSTVEEGYDNAWRTNSQPGEGSTPVLSITTYTTQSDSSYPRSYKTMVHVGVSENPDDVRNCLIPSVDQGEQVLPDKVIGGHTFKVFSFQDAAMMQYEKGVSYRTLFEDKCYAVEKIAHGSSYRDDPPSDRDIPDSVLDSEYDKLDRIVESFRFAR